MFNEPQIPPNTGTIGRLCVNLGATLHLVKPLGFDIDDKAVTRAGLDYWKELDLVLWESFDEFLAAHPIGENSHLATTKTDKLYFEASYKKGDFILFGSETKGIREDVLLDNKERCDNSYGWKRSKFKPWNCHRHRHLRGVTSKL